MVPEAVRGLFERSEFRSTMRRTTFCLHRSVQRVLFLIPFSLSAQRKRIKYLLLLENCINFASIIKKLNHDKQTIASA